MATPPVNDATTHCMDPVNFQSTGTSTALATAAQSTFTPTASPKPTLPVSLSPPTNANTSSVTIPTKGKQKRKALPSKKSKKKKNDEPTGRIIDIADCEPSPPLPSQKVQSSSPLHPCIVVDSTPDPQVLPSSTPPSFTFEDVWDDEMVTELLQAQNPENTSQSDSVMLLLKQLLQG